MNYNKQITYLIGKENDYGLNYLSNGIERNNISFIKKSSPFYKSLQLGLTNNFKYNGKKLTLNFLKNFSFYNHQSFKNNETTINLIQENIDYNLKEYQMGKNNLENGKIPFALLTITIDENEWMKIARQAAQEFMDPYYGQEMTKSKITSLKKQAKQAGVIASTNFINEAMKMADFAILDQNDFNNITEVNELKEKLDQEETQIRINELKQQQLEYQEKIRNNTIGEMIKGNWTLTNNKAFAGIHLSSTFLQAKKTLQHYKNKTNNLSDFITEEELLNQLQIETEKQQNKLEAKSSESISTG